MAAAIFGFVLPRISVLERDMVPPVDEFDSTRFGAYIPCQNYGFSVACNATKRDEKWQSLWQAQASQWYAPLDIFNGNITNDHYSTQFKQLGATQNFNMSHRATPAPGHSSIDNNVANIGSKTARVGTRTQVA